MFKRLAILALASVLLVSARTSAKNYTINISDSATVGNAQLTPGQYHIKLDGSQVVLTDKAGNQIDASAKLETADHKFEQTSITTSKADGTNRILSIQLGGGSNLVVFQ
jgi:hypothetical protein